VGNKNEIVPISVQKADGTEYEPLSLHSLFASLNRYLKEKSYPEQVMESSCFTKTRESIRAKQNSLKVLVNHMPLVPYLTMKSEPTAHVHLSTHFGGTIQCILGYEAAEKTKNFVGET
jgi:hypothetical protein